MSDTTAGGAEPPRRPRKPKKQSRVYSDEFWKQIDEIFTAVWAKEFNRLDLLPEIENVLRSEVERDTIYAEEARSIMERYDHGHRGSPGQGELFLNDELVALGDNMRIRRGSMNLDQGDRYKNVHEVNWIRQSKAYITVSEWWAPRRKLFLERPGATVEEVMTEGGEPIPPRTH